MSMGALDIISVRFLDEEVASTGTLPLEVTYEPEIPAEFYEAIDDWKSGRVVDFDVDTDQCADSKES
jgi:antitoxin component of RelBE/YafQ-DinJ toxin-antitoxin module